MTFKGVIFDLDGVICSTDELHYKAWKAIADKLNIYFDRTINNRLRGVSRMQSLEIILEKSEKKYSAQVKQSFAEEKNAIYVESLKTMSTKDVSDDCLMTLKKLKDKNIKIAIGSSSKNARTILKQLGVFDLFDAVSDGNNISKSKPDPEVFIKASKMLGLKPKDCLVVEDAFSGIDAGVNGGFKTAGYGDASGYNKADYKLNALSDLLNII